MAAAAWRRVCGLVLGCTKYLTWHGFVCLAGQRGSPPPSELLAPGGSRPQHHSTRCVANLACTT